MTERMIQVPVPLIERIAASSIENPDEDALIELSHLLVQQTPTVEHDEECFAGEWNEAAGVTCVCTCGVEPVQKGVSTDRLRDMADLLDGLSNRVTLRQAADELDRLRSSAPTREQIASLDATDLANWAQERTGRSIWPSTAAAVRDAVLARLNGADR